MKILALTLARGGSKSVPRKNIRVISGKPLIAYTILEALKSKFIDRYIVSTDDKEIKEISLSYGAEVPFLRPSEISGDTASSVAALQHAVNFAENEEGIKYDYIIELMCTNPLKTVEDIDACIKKIIKTKSDSVIAMHRIEDHHPIRVKKIIKDQIYDFCLPESPESRRQDLNPHAYVRSGSIYALKRDHLMIESRRYGSNSSKPYILPSHRAINVDTEVDVIVAEHMIDKL